MLTPTMMRAMLSKKSMAFLFVLTAGCAGDLENPESFRDGGGDGGGVDAMATTACPPEIDVPRDILAAPGCSRLGCHSASGPNVAPDLESPNVAERLISIPTSGCSGDRLLIDPADSSKSYLLESLNPSPACGSQMPIGGVLTAEEISCVNEWVEGL